MRTHWLGYVCFLVLACISAVAAPNCINGRGELNRPLWDGYTLQIAPAQGEHVNECRAAVVGPDGKAIFETFGVDAGVNPMSGRDINNDGKPDVLIESHTAEPGNVYSIVATTEPAGLVRQIVTQATLSFEDRKGDGHMEIVTRDLAFSGFEGLAPEDSPKPLVFLRMRGKELYSVASLYWPDYEVEITRAKARLGRDDVSEFRGTMPNAKTDKEKAEGPSPQEQRRNYATRAAVLEVVVDYLYAGKGQEAWQYLKESWPYADRARVQQAILRTRMSGVLGDINRSATKPPASQ